MSHDQRPSCYLKNELEKHCYIAEIYDSKDIKFTAILSVNPRAPIPIVKIGICLAYRKTYYVLLKIYFTNDGVK